MIQPFDGGRFDKRYEDVFRPAVVEAGLEPYRVDHDPGVSIPIREIEAGIMQAAVCFADITEDNPNVWFELGYAIAVNKDLCLVCSTERSSRYPFDVQHRNIVKYSVDSSQDFDKLKERIIARLAALLEKQQTRQTLPTVSASDNKSELAEHVIACLASLAMQVEGLEGAVSHYAVKNEMEKFGYNNLATHVALRSLLQNGLISVGKENDDVGNEYETYSVSPSGWDWVSDNLSDLRIRTDKPGGSFGKELDDEIPF